MPRMSKLLREITCANCGKTFVWSFKIKDYIYKCNDKNGRRIYFCSEKCMNEYKEKRK